MLKGRGSDTTEVRGVQRVLALLLTLVTSCAIRAPTRQSLSSGERTVLTHMRP